MHDACMVRYVDLTPPIVATLSISVMRRKWEQELGKLMTVGGVGLRSCRQGTSGCFSAIRAGCFGWPGLGIA